MNVVVVGGTGLIGRLVVDKLKRLGHTAVVASPSTGVDAVRNIGVDAALAGADTVVDVTNATAFDEPGAVSFFETATRHLLEAEKRAGVGHHVVLSIVGADRVKATGYLAGKVAQEKEVARGGIPHTIVRATQFFEFLGTVADASTANGVVRVTDKLMQPIAAAEVADVVVQVATGEAANGVVEVAGPESGPVSDFVRRVLADRADGRTVVADPEAGYFGNAIDRATLTPAGAAQLGRITLAEWLAS